jgi:serine protease Do
MNLAFRRLLALATVFALAFISVSALRVCKAGGSWRDVFSGGWAGAGKHRPEIYTLAEHPPLEVKDTELLSRLNEEYAKLTEAVVPSVISIDTVGVRTERLFDGWGRSRIRRYPTEGKGSGVIVTKEGHAITNHHVIAGQQQIQVTLHSGKTYPAILIGEDSLLDIAVLKIEGEQPFVPLKLGDSSQVRVGQLVFAIGNPFGLGETVTKGIISAKERSLSDNQRNLFQTDAAINPGNSGGPLVNLRGEIIAINVAIYTKNVENPGFQGVGFSIPSDDVRDALEQILKRGRPIRGFLGVEMRDLDPAVRAAIGYEGEVGAVVMGLTAGSPAETAGLQAWDVILTYDGEEIKATSQLISLVQRTGVGKTVAIKVWRRGQVLEVKAKIEECTSVPAEAQDAGADKPQGRTSGPEQVLRALGVVARDLTVQEVLRGYHGAVVTQITRNSLADGLVKPGDLVVAVNQSKINSANEFYIHLAASAAVQTTSLQLLRNGQGIRVNLPGVPRED